MIYCGDAIEYIEETPKILKNILLNAEAITEQAVELIERVDPEEVYMIGCGSSLYGAKASIIYFQTLLGIRFFAMSPEELLSNRHFINKKSIVIGISQQGTSVSVISAMDEIRKSDIKVIALTGEYNTEITRHADATLYIECGYEDAGATTKGFTATVFTLMMLSKSLWMRKSKMSNQQKSIIDTYFKNKINSMQEELYLMTNMCDLLAERLKESTDLIIISGEKWRNILGEIVLKFNETCRFSIRGFDTQEFMHGYYNAVNENTDFLLLWDDEAGEIEKLYNYYLSKGNRVFCIGKKDKDQDMTDLYNEDIALWEKGSFSVFRDILMLQKVFVLTSKKRGINLNILRDPNFHIIMGSKLELKNNPDFIKNKRFSG